MKKILLATLILLSSLDGFSNHTKGGWMYYEYLGAGVNDPSKLRYRIVLNLYIDCNSSLIESSWNFSFFKGSSPYTFIQDVAVNASPSVSIAGCITASCYPCINNIQGSPRCYQIIKYETIVELAPSLDGYIVSKQRCCRITGISNILPPSTTQGATYSIKIPGSEPVTSAAQNSSPKFIFNDTAIVCGGSPFNLSFAATDQNNDSLSYQFCSAYNGADNVNSNPATAAPPPYGVVPYSAPYSGTQPLGSAVTINPVTGMISGIAPPPGEYVVCVCVFEYRNGVYIGETRKEIHLKVANCQPLNPRIDVDPVTCDGFNVQFFNNATNPAGTTYTWTFGHPASGSLDTSHLQNPTHLYTDTGMYTIKLVVDLNGQCKDSSTRVIGVYPGLYPKFISSAPLCVNLPVQFTDISVNRFGTNIGWRWDFGDPTTLADTSHLQNPLYTYTVAGIYPVTLHIESDKGCSKDTIQNITINQVPTISLFPKDTTYCALDTLQLTATGTGNFSWLPNYNIIGAATGTPLVYPAVPTKYTVTLDNNGCKSYDSTLITPLNDITNSIIASNTNICAEDTITLTGNSNKINNVTWSWSPVATLSNPTNRITDAYPVVATTYTLITTWGSHCVANASIPIIVKPLAVPNAGPDATICAGQATAQLSASGGVTYTWSPPTGLSNPNIANPVANPSVDTKYTVAVGVVGCSKTKSDTAEVFVRVLPALATLNDTLICTIDTLQLTTNGTGNFVWTPNYMISSTTAQSPMVSPDVPTTYFVRLTDAFGCYKDDTVFVNVKAVVALNAGNDTALCKTDGFLLNTVSDALHYKWTPNLYINSDTAKRPFTIPTSTITYHVIANIGKCQNEDSVTIKVVNYPAANAGVDTAVCIGDDAHLHASGGTNYVWSPATFLNNRNIPNPTAISPTGSIRYIVNVTDTLGCPKSVQDTVFVTVYPKIIANAGPRDTSVVLGEPLQLHATGATNYLWTPNTWLNNNAIADPVSLPQAITVIEYVLEARNVAGCLGTDTIRVTVYDLESSFYVPTGFTPNGDGLNDKLTPIALGMRELTYFNVYNRFGQLVFSTSTIGQGWDGVFKGRPQDMAAYVWYAEGVTFKGRVIKKKGNALLIR